MIGSIRGIVSLLAKEYCLVENNGIGYRVFMPSSNLAQLNVGQETYIHIYTNVREDAILLYGFLDQPYYHLFLQLTSVSGIGPKVAINILSQAKPDTFYLAIQNRDTKLLTTLPGIGKKTAERLILELKDKIGPLIDNNEIIGEEYIEENISCTKEAVDALRSLGYSNGEIYPLLKNIERCEELSTEEIIKMVLKQMAGRN
ncbi:MAG TPA: Holliday junction branch migration protein RuvA [Candidatus Avacidaminococcus intestinavium]|uniref:Holliday junction branch migration complex subunit RuvA n=1 Tax=Candidatus Avacidaminococcus intestinavium TaxID=2840684 RepID=A0A9D1SLQ6_9FIRM|nr:Holliday junction branch migration protein RuvA [Candidatus Avacidaminococcus intestinavium]